MTGAGPHGSTTHLSYTSGFQETPDKDTEVASLLDAVDGNRERFILTGDFNCMPDSTYIQRIGASLCHCGPPFGLPSWTTKPFSYQGFDADALDWRLDYVFATPDVNVTEAEIVQTVVSDHLPVVVTVG